jgi:hypothetical protein
MNPRLLRAYRCTNYHVSGIDFHIGRRSAALDTLLHKAGVRTAVLISADNPFSRKMPGGWNIRMRTRLQERLRRRITLPAYGSWRNWCEHHFFVLGPIGPSQNLARFARQNGIVIVRRGQPPRLLATLRMPDPMKSHRQAWMEH